MSVSLKNRNYLSCTYGCCGDLETPKAKKGVRRRIRARGKQKLARDIRNQNF
jgi:hypothetical protein